MIQDAALASRWQRLGAFMIDGAFIWVISFLFILALHVLGLTIDEQTGQALDRALGKAIGLFFYFPIFTALWGATPGKRILKLKVVSDDGMKLSAGKVILREMIGRWISVIVLGHFWIFFNKRKKTAWDFLVGSIVVRV